MPALSPTMTEGHLVKWHKKEGDTVESGDVLAEIETDKATMEIEAVDEGVLGKILVPAGTDNVKVNTIIGYILEPGEIYDPEKINTQEKEGICQQNKDASPPQKQEIQKAPHEREQKPPPEEKTTKRVRISPLAKRLVQLNSLDITTLQGSGPRGRIVKADIDATLKKQSHHPQPASTTHPLSRMRRIIAARLTEAKRDIPHFYLSVECMLDPLMIARKKLNQQKTERQFSINDFIIKAVAMALKEVPAVNVSWHEEHFIQYAHADIAVAVAVEEGLYTPIVRAAEQKSLSDISNEMKTLIAKAREGKLMPEDYQGGTFSISNLGMYGIKNFQAILNPPQSCILAVGAGQKTVVPLDTNDQVGVRTVMQCTLSLDHRIVDGAVGAQWLQSFKKLIEDPLLMLV